MKKKLITIISIISLILLVSSTYLYVSASNGKKLKLNKSTVTLSVGRKTTLKVTVKPKGEKAKVQWKTSDVKVAAVSRGVVTAKKEGKANITAYIGKKKVVCKVIVKNIQKPVVTEPPSMPADIPDVTSPVPLTNQQIIDIKQAYVSQLKAVNSDQRYQNLTHNDIKINKYYGTYHGAVAVELLIAGQAYTDALWDYEAAGYTFAFTDGGGNIKLYKDTGFVWLKQAFEKNMIFKEDVAYIHALYTQKKYLTDFDQWS